MHAVNVRQLTATTVATTAAARRARAPVLSEALAALLRELHVPLARRAQRLYLLLRVRVGEERLAESSEKRVGSRREARGGARAKGPTLTKFTLCGCTVRMASVRPCRNALVIAGSYVHSVRPSEHETHRVNE